MKVSKIMKKNYIRIEPDMDISHIAELLSKKAESEILVMDEEDSLLGIITRTDLLYKDIEPDIPLFVEFLGGIIYVQNMKHYQEELRKLLSTRAKEFMTTNVITISIDDTIEHAAKVMVEKKVSHLPVMQENKMIGILRKSDIVKYVAALIKEEPPKKP